MRLLYVLKRYAGKIEIGQPFKTLIKCIISQRTREEMTEKAAKRLFAIASSPSEIARLDVKRIEKAIKPCGFYKQKAKRIKEIARIIAKRYGGHVPKDRKTLLSLPGVGWKTSAVVLAYGHGIPIIAVDTHTARIAKRLGLVEGNANVEEVRKALEVRFKKSDWKWVNIGMVNFGRAVCLPRRPKCQACPLRSICKFYNDRRTLPS